MADVDTTPVQAAEDTGLSDAAEPTTPDETLNQEDELDDVEKLIQGFEESEAELVEVEDDESEEEEPEEEAATDSEVESKPEPDEDGEVEEESEPQELTKPTDNKPSDEERKRLNDEAAKRRIAEKQLKEEREAREKADIQRFLSEAEDDREELARREVEVEKFLLQKEKTSLNEERLRVSLDRAAADIDLFRTGSDEVKEELAKSLDDFERMYVTRDDKGNVLEVRGDVYQFLTDKAESIHRLTGIGARQESQNKKKTRARTDTLPSKKPKESKEDPMLKAFYDAANEYS